MSIHKSVLSEKVLEALDPKQNENFIDCTVGEGGHAKIILDKIGPAGKVLGIDWDENQIERCRNNIKSERLILVNDSYVNLKNIVNNCRFAPVNGILMDLGFSSAQLGYGKGFSFQKNEPLDMRYSSKSVLTAEDIINNWPENELENIFREYGEERFSSKIASKIVSQRKIKRIEKTNELVEIIKTAIPKKFQHGRIHCATKVFQAIRIKVNGELENVMAVLDQAEEILAKDGRLAIISFHSLEDRLIKNFLKQKEKESKIKILNKKPITADLNEVNDNPRSRSAKLRVGIKI